MTLFANIFGWIARHALVFITLVAAMAIYGQYRNTHAPDLVASITRIDAAQTDLIAEIETLRRTTVTKLNDAERLSLTAIDARIRTATADLAKLQRRRPPSLNLLKAPGDAITASVRHDFQIERLTQEIAFLTNLRTNVATRGEALGLDAQIADRDRRIAADDANIAALPGTLSPSRYIRCGMKLCDLADVYAERRAANAAAKSNLIAARQRLGEIAALVTPTIAVAALERLLAPHTDMLAVLRAQIAEELPQQVKSWWDKLGIFDLLRPAAFALLLIILTPFLIRTLFYWVLAPLASLQKPIQLLDNAAPIPLPTERSGVSRSLSLTPGTELLIRQGFEQTLSLGGAKATQWLLDTRFPISSLASGLCFLTRIRGAPGDTITVSAIRDPFAEIAVLTLPTGAAAVVQPRAIAGVVQAIASPLRITSHWRLGTLNAWLTWQLRFLVFHGPADIILTGGRGVRIEPALAGRSIGQDQLIGFSAGIAYSTGRTETFIPYLFGREPLLKDRIAAGSGVLIAEEAPLAGRRGGGFRQGLEGVADAILKVFGI